MKRTQVLNLGKHFSIIDSPVPFYLIDNYGFRAYRPSGAWQFDNWKLLPEKFHKNYPVYTLSIEWDSGVNDDIFPTFTDTDLDLGDGIAGVSGQPVNITTPITVANLPNVVVGKQNTVPVHIETDLQPLEVQNKLTFGDWKVYETLDEIPLGFYLCTGIIGMKTTTSQYLVNNAVLHLSSAPIFDVFTGQVVFQDKEIPIARIEKTHVSYVHLMMKSF